MKLKAFQVDDFASGLTPHTAPALVLVYGADRGGVQEVARTIARNYLGPEPDALQTAELADSELTSAAALRDEAAAIPMFGERKLVRLRGVAGKAGEALKHYLAAPPDNALVLVEADNLRPANGIRKLAEAEARAMALPCFEPDRRDIIRLAQTYLQSEHYKIEAAALDVLAARLATDRGVLQRELERLVLFKGPADAANPGLLTLDDVDAALGDVAQSSLQELADHIALGQADAADRALTRLAAAGTPAVAALNPVRAHFVTLHLALGLMENGTPAARALSAFKPPLHFKRKPLVEQQLRLWSRRKLARALQILNEAEFDSRHKNGGNSQLAAAMTGQALLRLARAAQR